MLRPELAAAVGGNCKVVLCATHDTGSAVEGIPMEGNQPYISSGTWSLLGVKTPKPITDAESEKANYSNEGGVGYNRYQKNIMGMWLVNELQRERCPDMKFPEIVKLAEKSTCDILIDANAPEFLAPKSMKAAFDKAIYLDERVTNEEKRANAAAMRKAFDAWLEKNGLTADPTALTEVPDPCEGRFDTLAGAIAHIDHILRFPDLLLI